MSDINIIEEYRALMTAVLKDRMTDNERVMCLNQLAEMRAGYTAGMWAEEKVTGVEQAPSKMRLVWNRANGFHYLAPAGVGVDGSYYSTARRYAFRFPGGGLDDDRRVPVASVAEGLRVITDLARVDGYECDEHPDAAPATTADAPTLPPGLRGDDGWISWGGGACPCPGWPEVEYVCRNGYRGMRRPENLTWTHRDDIGPGDIVAYRRPR